LETKQVSLYVDGMLDANVREIPTPNSATNAKLHIGNNSFLDVSPSANPYFFSGKMDGVRIYNRKLTGAEIAKLLTITD
ncbi:MAG: LamG domain-containing protein, partial [Sphingobacteriales bacterium]